MRTFLRVSLLGNAFIDLACILFLLHRGGANQPPEVALSPEPTQVVVTSDRPIGIFGAEAPLAWGELPGFHPAGLLGGNTLLADLLLFGGIPRHTTAYDVGWLTGRLEGMPFALRLGDRAYPGLSP